MTQKTYIIEGRQFRTEADYKHAVRDKEIIDKLRIEIKRLDRKQLEQLISDIRNGKYRFMTLLGQDFADELELMLQKPLHEKKQGSKKDRQSAAKVKTSTRQDEVLDAIVQQELKKKEKRRRIVLIVCGLLGVSCLGYFGLYSFYNYRTEQNYKQLSQLKDAPLIQQVERTPVIHYTVDEEIKPKEVLDEYKNLLNKNKKLIGWVKIDDTNIDYPVMQTSDNEYYLKHNLNQEYDRNGSIFMDKDCDVLKPSTNFILYGHHMNSGKMFGKLDLYEKESYYQEHRYIQFDTIYEKGMFEVMYVFRSKVYSEGDIVFKYYQFIDAVSEQEFYSNMQEMEKMSLYDTGVSAEYGDQLLTLSTCDDQGGNGRFVVVAKKVAAKE